MLEIFCQDWDLSSHCALRQRLAIWQDWDDSGHSAPVPRQLMAYVCAYVCGYMMKFVHLDTRAVTIVERYFSAVKLLGYSWLPVAIHTLLFYGLSIIDS